MTPRFIAVIGALCLSFTILVPPNHTLAANRNFLPLLHCKGSTRAKIHIAWPGAGARAVPFGRHVPSAVRRWAYLIMPIARMDGVDPYLVAGVMRVESGGDPLAWNLDSDAHGLMQVLHASFQPVDNIRLGVSMLADLQRRFASRDLALAGYNAGPGAVEQYGGIPPYTETRDYVVMVDYFRDLFAGTRLSPARTAHFKAARAELDAFYKRLCGRR